MDILKVSATGPLAACLFLAKKSEGSTSTGLEGVYPPYAPGDHAGPPEAPSVVADVARQRPVVNTDAHYHRLRRRHEFG